MLATAPGHLVASPWRTLPQSDPAFDQMFVNLNRECPPPARWNHQRLRNTWFARHLTAGTPLPVLMTAAGVASVGTFAKLLPLLDEIDANIASTWLRGAP